MMTCPRCCRAADTEEEMQERCVDKKTIGCPSARETVPGKDIILTCRADACEKQFAVPAVALLRVIGGKRSIPAEISCMRTPCEVVVLTQPIANPDATPQEDKPGRRGAKGR